MKLDEIFENISQKIAEDIQKDIENKPQYKENAIVEFKKYDLLEYFECVESKLQEIKDSLIDNEDYTQAAYDLGVTMTNIKTFIKEYLE